MNQSTCSNTCSGTGRRLSLSLRETVVNDQPLSAVVNRITLGIRQEIYQFRASSDQETFHESDVTSSLSTQTSGVFPSLLFSKEDDYDDEILLLARELHRAVLSLDSRRVKGIAHVAEPHHDDPHSQLPYNSCRQEAQIPFLFDLRSLDEMLEVDRRNDDDGCLDDEQSLGDSTVDSLVYYRAREQKARNNLR